MNDKTSEKKNPVAKSLTVAGLIGAVILISWFAIQLVGVLPSALNSLASLADSVYNYDPKKDEALTLNTDNDTVTSGETINVSWNKMRESDTFVFSYQCQEGISVDIKTEEKEFSGVTCDNTYDLGSVERIEILVNSEKNRLSELKYNIDSFHKNSSTSTETSSQIITVINPSINEVAIEVPEEPTVDTDTEIIADNNSTIPETETPSDTESENITTSDEQEETQTETPIITTSIQPEYTQEYIYEIPTSNPNGTTDLVLSNLNVGSVGFTDFIETANIINSIDNGIRFNVHNIGTRTSENWTYSATLPGNINYKSKEQEPLKPNERATITIEFPQVLNDDELQIFSVTIISDNETNYANNQIMKTAIVVE